MKTDDLINVLSADLRPRIDISRKIVLAAGAGAVVAAVLFFSVLGLRPDVGSAIDSVRFVFKVLPTLALTCAAFGLVINIVHPGRVQRGWQFLLLVPVVLLAAAVFVELSVVPSSLWEQRMIGSNAVHCLTVIPLLSIIPGTCILMAMRHGAPEKPGPAGAAAALVSAGIAATLYATNCPDDSPLFVATWYPIATLLVAGVGYLAGMRFLRW